jgi:hypothetical protein
MIRDPGDVQQAVRARHDFDERAEVGDALHCRRYVLLARAWRSAPDDRDRLLPDAPSADATLTGRRLDIDLHAVR